MKKFGGKILIILTFITLTGCARKPMKTELPISHPANTQAQETPFAPPPNIFQGKMQIVETQPTPEASMTHKHHEKTDRKQTNHSDLKPQGSDAPTHSNEKKSMHQHEEQKQ